MNFVHHPEQLRETVQHRVDSVVHQADGILHSPRRSSQTRFVRNLPGLQQAYASLRIPMLSNSIRLIAELVQSSCMF